MRRDEQKMLFEVAPAWTEHWQGMPEFRQEDQTHWKSLKVHFRNEEDLRSFSELVGQPVTKLMRSIWYPEAEIGRYADKRYISRGEANPRYPVYVISKGRWDSRLTSKALERMSVPYRIVVEPQEYDNYAAVIDPARILVLPFSNLGQGSIPARNWVWDHSAANGDARHWIVDDNISTFMMLNNNLKVPVGDGTIFQIAEDFVDRYENVALAGFNYKMFAPRKQIVPPFYLNTRIYSCILIQNCIPYRFRGRYNEDTDLSLRVLKDGYCTVLFNAFLAEKQTTMKMKGGNTDELYQGNGRLLMARSLQEQHPDLVQITERWGRAQHYVNYKVFRRNKLILRPGVLVPEGQDDYGMALKMLEDGDNGRKIDA
jgi:hypothetical protein